jgi:hypothetical protein
VSSVYKKLLYSTSIVFCYLFIEWIYNQHLLILLSYDYINPDHFQFTEMFGKAIASFGLNLIINNIFKKSSFIRFLIGFVLGYVFLTLLFNHVINAFSNDFRYLSYYSMLYRKDVVNQTDKKEILKFTDTLPWYEKSLVISQFFYTLKDNEWKEFEKKVKEPISEKINKLNINRLQYYKDYKKFDNSYKQIMKAWGRYSAAEANYNAYKSFFNSDTKNKFIQKIGIPPGLSFDDFVKRTAPEYVKYSNIKLFEGSLEAKLNPIYLKDLPKKMNELFFNQYLDTQIKRITTQLAPEISNIRENQKSFDSLAILIIPPISICLSLFSIIFNVLILLAKWSYYLLKIKKMNFGIYSSLFLTITSIFIVVLASVKTTSIEHDKYWSALKDLNYNEHPILFSIFNTGIKLEPILCITSQEPKIIKNFTENMFHN